MLASGGGSIVNVASFVALMGAATAQIAYTASKGGVLSMTRELAVEYGRQGIRANSLCPGPIETPLLAELLSDPARRARRLVHIPMGRLGRAEELARAALFLASDDSSFMTGASLVVDGGITAAYVTPECTDACFVEVPLEHHVVSGDRARRRGVGVQRGFVVASVSTYMP